MVLVLLLGAGNHRRQCGRNGQPRLVLHYLQLRGLGRRTRTIAAGPLGLGAHA